MTVYRADLLKLRDDKLVVYGDLMIDRYWWGSCDRVSPEGTFPVFKRSGRVEHWLGGAGSAVHRARQLGTDARFVGLVGVDPMSEMAAGLLNKIGADPDYENRVARIPVFGVCVKTRLLDPLGHQCLARIDEDHQSPLEGAPLDLVIDKLKHAREHSEWILVSDYGKGMVTPELWAALLRQKWKIVVDGKGPWENYRGAEVLQVNRAAYERQCGRGGKHHAIGYMIGNDIASVVLTAGKNGLHLLDQEGGDRHFYTRGRDEPALSITGAGDQVAASLASALAGGLSITEACDLAQHSASLAVRMGGIPTLTNLAQRLPIFHKPDVDTLRFRDWDGSARDFAAEVRLGGQKLVFCNGIYDLFHPAHEFFLRRAAEDPNRPYQGKDPGRFLLVALNSDKSAKGIKRQPVVVEEHRAQIVKACRHVDVVCIFDGQTPSALIEDMRPDIYVSPADHGARSATANLARRLGGKVVVLPRGEISTTDIIKQIKGKRR